MEQDAEEQSPVAQANGPDTPTSLLFTIEIVRCLGSVSRARKSSIASIDPLVLSETHFETCTSAIPLQLEPYSVTDPRSTVPVIALQNSRLVLQRYNLSPTNSREVRRAALDRCVAISKDTSRFLSRMSSERSLMAGQGTQGGFDIDTLVPVASAMLCIHIWRCLLFLCAQGLYYEAQTCAKMSAAIGDLRTVNLACGEHLFFFLRLVRDWSRRSQINDLDADEEMLAYISGDAQGDVQHAWIWQEDDISLNISSPSELPGSPRPPAPTSVPTLATERHHSEPLPNTERASSVSPAAAPKTSQAGSWIQVLALLDELIKDQAIRRTREQSSAAPTTTTAASSSQVESRSSRISIASII